MSEELQNKLRHLPASPGVYMLKDTRGEILYVGKAKSLRTRVRNHFAVDYATSLKNREMVRRITDVDTIVTGSEAEALLLEANLIKAHHPRFNIQLRDDKKYPYIKVTVHEPFPRVWVTRRLDNDGSRYFGPYTEVGLLRQALELIKRLYTVRSCRYDLPKEAPDRPCLDYHIGRCKAPCVGFQSEPDYRAMIGEMLDVLGGEVRPVRKRVEREMTDAASSLDFERAAGLRDALAGLDVMERRQRMLDVRGGDQDVIGYARDGDRACAVQLRIRQGKLLGREMDLFDNVEGEPDEELLSTAALRFYLGRGDYGKADLPREILFPQSFEDMDSLAQILGEESGRRVRAHVPERGEKARLVDLAHQNARHLLEEQALLSEVADRRADDTLYELQEALDLTNVPRFIVCFDVSHTQGSEVVASAAAFRNAEPWKAEYRKFRVRGDWGNDDFRSMAEVLERYLKRRTDEQKPLPDLIVIDGGKGQLSAASEVLARMGLESLEICSLAKREEEVYLPDRALPLRLPRSSAALRVLQRIRDEAHRFAVGYNRKLRAKRTLRSELGEIPGIGPTRQTALLRHFGSVRALRAAAPEAIAEVPGFSRRLAEAVHRHLQGVKTP
ncbi:MAG TPA: excinuclease ABC subunit UvrC [Longimicrobiales bacterium]